MKYVKEFFTDPIIIKILVFMTIGTVFEQIYKSTGDLKVYGITSICGYVMIETVVVRALEVYNLYKSKKSTQIIQ